MKKHVFLLLALALGLTACHQKNNGFKVNIGCTNGNDQTVYLQKYVGNYTTVIDSAVITNDQAVLTAPLDNAQIRYGLRVKGKRSGITFFADNKDVSVLGDINNPEIIASESQAELNSFNEQMHQYIHRIKDLYADMQQTISDNDSIKMDSIHNVIKALTREQEDFRDEYIKTHPESFIAHYILDCVKQEYPLDQLKEMVGAFTTESIYRDQLNEYITKKERLEVGQPFIDFTLKTKDGQNIKLSEKIAQNKLTLIDFWASWCRPCRQENPIVKAAYEQYHALGFDVLGISIDVDENNWIAAVEEDQLPWTQVRDCDETVCEDYMIYYIPSNFLFDQNGTMVAKSLRGEELAAKLAEILN